MSLFLSWQQSVLVMEVAKVDQGPVILVIMSGGGFDNAIAKNDNNKIVTVLWVGYQGYSHIGQ